MADIQDDLIKDKRKNETWFCACLYFGSHDIALRDCAWLEPDIFSDSNMGKYWGLVKGGANPLTASAMAGVEYELVKNGYQANLIRPDEYAQRIAEGAYYLKAVEKAQGVAKCVMNKDMLGIKQLADELANDTPAKTVEYHTAKTIGAEFKAMIASGSTPVIKTYIPEVDNKLGGFFPRDLIILAARPGYGKTAIATQFARNVARAKKKSLFFSIEMDRRQLWARMACGLVGLNWTDVRIGNITADQTKDLDKATDQLIAMYGDYFIVLDDTSTVSGMIQAVSHIRPEFVIVDHLGEIDWPDPNEKEVTWYGKAAKALRREMGKRYGIPVLLIHQLNRNLESRDDKRPMLADLRWSGALEQTADVVLMMYRDCDDDVVQTTGISPTELIVRKNRQGSLSTINLTYDLNKQWFT